MEDDNLILHQCFNTSKNIVKTEKIHIPIASECGLGCFYCDFNKSKNIMKYNGLPGTSEHLVESEKDMISYLSEKFSLFPSCNIIGVSGPGDPLINLNQFNSLLNIIENHYPEKTICVCTSGANWNRSKNTVLKCNNIKYMTVTINTLKEQNLSKIYSSIKEKKIEPYQFIQNQRDIVIDCLRNEINVKLNIVYIEGVNDVEILDIYNYFKPYGLNCINLLPKIDKEINPVCKNKTINFNENASYAHKINELYKNNVPLVTHCFNCSSDYCG